MEELNKIENLPMWGLVLILLLNLFREPLAKLIFDVFPGMADRHFGALAKDKSDRREFDQKKAYETLKSDLELLGAAQKTSDNIFDRQTEREKTYIKIIDNQFAFMHKLIDVKFIKLETTIVEEITSLKKSFDLLTKELYASSPRSSTREILLKRIVEVDD